MKKILVCLCLISSFFALNAQSIRPDMNEMVNEMPYKEAFYNFFNKRISYSEAHKKYLARYFDWLFNETDFVYNHNRIKNAEFFSLRGPDIEVEAKDGNIYTYPVAYSNAYYTNKYNRASYYSYDDPDIITFYSTELNAADGSPHNIFVSIHGRSYSMVQAGMNKIKIGMNIGDISTCFSGINTDGTLEVLTPEQYLRSNNLGSDKIIITMNATYSGKPSIIYTKPTWTVIGGQPLEVDNGIHYEVPLHNATFLTIVNTSTMRSEVHALKGIHNMYMKYNKQNQRLFIYDGDKYGGSYYSNPYSTISKNQSPIYVVEINPNGTLTTLASIIPQEGDVITDIQQSYCGKYIIMCGTNKNRGYVGYDNAMFIVYDSTTFKELGRYRGKRKDRYFTKLTCIDEENIHAQYDDWHSSYFNDGRGPNRFEIINIPSLITPAN